MKREIKFRAWDTRINDWFRHGDGFALSWDATEIFDDNDKIEHVKDNIIFQQYTGLKDKNGKEIYEGDIVKHINKSRHTKKEYWFPVYKVVAEPFKFNLIHIGGGLCNGSWWLPLSNWGEMKIIGNIYENPDLLK